MTRLRSIIILFLFVVACSVAESVSENTYLNTQVLYAFSAYCPKSAIFNWTCYWCTQPNTIPLTIVTTIYNSADDTFAYVGYNDKYIQIAIRGTIATSFTDWMEDFEFDKTTFSDMPPIEVHVGFYNIYKGLRSDLIKAFVLAEVLCPECTELHVTGHSLGGAVATIAAAELQNLTKLDVKLTTFGSPRVGNQAFSQFIARELEGSSRVVHARDIVTHVPPLSLGFYHIPIEFWQHNGNLTKCDSSGEDPTCSYSVSFLSFADHLTYMNYYLWAGFPDCAGVFEYEATIVQR